MTHLGSRLEAAGRIGIETVTMPEAIPADHVRLRLATASICGTDMHYFRHFANAGFALERPTTLGHEACGRVDDANGHDFAPGRLVAINPLIACGACEKCRAGDVNMCPSKRFPGSATTRPHIDGFFREVFDFPARCCRPVPEGTDPSHLTFAEPLACALHAVNRGAISADTRVLVTGCGPMGLLATVGAAARGAEVHASDVRPAAAAAALKVGASKALVTGEDQAPSAAYDVVIEASGSPHAYNAALEAVRKQGTIVILSLIQPSPTPIDLHKNALKEISSVGSILYTGEFDEARDLIVSGQVDFDAVIAARMPVSRTQEAFELMASGQAVGKVLIVPEATA